MGSSCLSHSHAIWRDAAAAELNGNPPARIVTNQALTPYFAMVIMLFDYIYQSQGRKLPGDIVVELGAQGSSIRAYITLHYV